MRSRRANGRCLLAFLALALILAVSCREPARSPAAESGATTGSTSAPPATRRDVRLAYVSTATTFTPLWAAQEYGLLEQYGLHTDGLLYINGGPAIAQALVAGELDGAYSAFSPMVTAIMGGADLKVVAGFSYGFVHQLFTREGTGVRQPQDLVGKRAGVSRIGAESHTVIQLWARTHGLRDDAITYVNAGGAAERLAALDAGAIDLVPLDPPEVIAAQKRGYQRIADLTQETIPWQADGLTVPEKLLQADPALARAIVQAVAEAVYLLRGDRERFQAALTQYTKIEDPDALAAAYAAWVRRVNPHGRPDAAWVQSVQQVVDETMAGTAQQPTTRFLDLSVLDGLEQDRFFDRLEQQYPVPADARP